MWSKKWYLKRNISCDAHLLNELLEKDVPWDDAIVVSAGKLRKLWDFLSELRSSLCERRLERTVLRPELWPVKTAHFTQFFRQAWHHTIKSRSLTESVLRPYRYHPNRAVFSSLHQRLRDTGPYSPRAGRERGVKTAGSWSRDNARGSTQCDRKTSTNSPSNEHTSNAGMTNVFKLMNSKITSTRFMTGKFGDAGI